MIIWIFPVFGNGQTKTDKECNNHPPALPGDDYCFRKQTLRCQYSFHYRTDAFQGHCASSFIHVLDAWIKLPAAWPLHFPGMGAKTRACMLPEVNNLALCSFHEKYLRAGGLKNCGEKHCPNIQQFIINISILPNIIVLNRIEL